MAARSLSLASIALLAACAGPGPSREDPPPAGEPTGERRVSFACDGGEQVEVRFFPLQGVAVLVRDGRTRELQQQPVASGFLYADATTRVRGKGDELTLEDGDAAPLACRAR